MAINYEIFDFPTLGIQSQLFYAGGAAYEGGFTSGGARVLTPEPGGRAFLEMQLSLQVNEWSTPFTSWLMSKVNNGAIFRVPLTKTPQLVSDAALGINDDVRDGIPWEVEGLFDAGAWDNGKFWASDGLVMEPVAEALEGSTKLTLAAENNPVTFGHVIGIGDYSYIIDGIDYSDDGSNIVWTISPPLRKDVTTEDMILTRPFFLGVVSNGAEFRAAYERANSGHIQPGRLLFTEVIL